MQIHKPGGRWKTRVPTSDKGKEVCNVRPMQDHHTYNAVYRPCPNRRNRRTAANKHTFPDCSADLWQKCSSPCDSCRKIFSHIAPHELYNDNSDIHGTGLFARCPILEGTMIAEFVGKKSDPETISNGFVLQLQEKWITPLGTHRFVNHSCEPNAMFQKWSDEKGDEKVSICALTDIPENAEVCVSYGREHHLSIGEMRCTCRSTQCVSQGFNKPIP